METDLQILITRTLNDNPGLGQQELIRRVSNGDASGHSACEALGSLLQRGVVERQGELLFVRKH